MSESEVVLQALRASFTAHDAGDVEAFLRYLHPAGTLFHTNADLLIPLDHDTVRAAHSAGYGGQIAIRHAEANVYEENAVVTAYLGGIFKWAGGGSVQGTWRYSSVWCKENGQWRIVHTHISPLSPQHTAALAGNDSTQP